MIQRTSGKIILTASKAGALEPLSQLAIEQWLNNEIANQIYNKFGVAMRVHLEEE